MEAAFSKARPASLSVWHHGQIRHRRLDGRMSLRVRVRRTLLLHSERIRGLAVQVGGVLVLFRAAAEKAEAAGCAGESFFGLGTST
jgi:hypothetical protein